MRTALDFLAGHGDQPIPVFLVEQTLELSRAVGVGAFGNDEKRCVLDELDRAVETGTARLLGLDGARLRGALADGSDQKVYVLDRGATAPADHVHAVVRDESQQCFDERFGGERKGCFSFHQHGQARVGNDRDRAVPVTRKPGNMLAHLRRPRRAVQTQRRNGKHPQGVRGGGNLRPQKHCAGCFDGDAGEDGNVFVGLAAFFKSVETGVDRALDLKQVLAGFDEEGIRTPVDQPPGLLGITVEHLLPGRLSERDELGPRPHRADDETRLVGGGVFLAGGTGNLRRFAVEVVSPTDEFLIKITEDELVGPEGVGLDGIGPDFEEGFMDTLHQVWTTADQDIHAILSIEIIPADIKIHRLDGRTHRAIKNDDASLELVKESADHDQQSYSGPRGLSTFHPDERMEAGLFLSTRKNSFRNSSFIQFAAVLSPSHRPQPR